MQSCPGKRGCWTLFILVVRIGTAKLWIFLLQLNLWKFQGSWHSKVGRAVGWKYSQCGTMSKVPAVQRWAGARCEPSCSWTWGNPLAGAEWSRYGVKCLSADLRSLRCACQVQRQHFKSTFINSYKYKYLGIRNSNVWLEVLLDIAHKILNCITWPNGCLYSCHFIGQRRRALNGSKLYLHPS